MASIDFKITNVGKAALLDSDGLSAVTIKNVLVGTGNRAVDGTETSLVNQTESATFTGDVSSSNDSFAGSALISSGSSTDIKELGITGRVAGASSDILLYYYSTSAGNVLFQTDLHKSIKLNIGIRFENRAATTVTFEDKGTISFPSGRLISSYLSSGYAYSASVNYKKGDLVFYETSTFSGTFMSAADNNRGNTPTLSNQTHWIFIAYAKNGTDGKNGENPFKGAWSSSTTYKINHIVTRYNRLYFAIRENTNQNPLSSTSSWSEVNARLFMGAYQSAAIYRAGDIVSDSNILYYSEVDNNRGNTPSSSPNAWRRLTGRDAFVGNWNSATAYVTGDIVIHSSKFYLAKNNNTNVSPSANGATWLEIGGGGGGTDLKIIDTLAERAAITKTDTLAISTADISTSARNWNYYAFGLSDQHDLDANDNIPIYSNVRMPGRVLKPGQVNYRNGVVEFGGSDLLRFPDVVSEITTAKEFWIMARVLKQNNDSYFGVGKDGEAPPSLLYTGHWSSGNFSYWNGATDSTRPADTTTNGTWRWIFLHVHKEQSTNNITIWNGNSQVGQGAVGSALLNLQTGDTVYFGTDPAPSTSVVTNSSSRFTNCMVLLPQNASQTLSTTAERTALVNELSNFGHMSIHQVHDVFNERIHKSEVYKRKSDGTWDIEGIISDRVKYVANVSDLMETDNLPIGAHVVAVNTVGDTSAFNRYHYYALAASDSTSLTTVTSNDSDVTANNTVFNASISNGVINWTGNRGRVSLPANVLTKLNTANEFILHCQVRKPNSATDCFFGIGRLGAARLVNYVRSGGITGIVWNTYGDVINKKIPSSAAVDEWYSVTLYVCKRTGWDGTWMFVNGKVLDVTNSGNNAVTHPTSTRVFFGSTPWNSEQVKTGNARMRSCVLLIPNDTHVESREEVEMIVERLHEMGHFSIQNMRDCFSVYAPIRRVIKGKYYRKSSTGVLQEL